MIEENLLDAARISRRQDGRHPKFWKLLLKSASMKAIVSYVYELATASNFPTLWIISCDHGRHSGNSNPDIFALVVPGMQC